MLLVCIFIIWLFNNVGYMFIIEIRYLLKIYKIGVFYVLII